MRSFIKFPSSLPYPICLPPIWTTIPPPACILRLWTTMHEPTITWIMRWDPSPNLTIIISTRPSMDRANILLLNEWVDLLLVMGYLWLGCRLWIVCWRGRSKWGMLLRPNFVGIKMPWTTVPQRIRCGDGVSNPLRSYTMIVPSWMTRSRGRCSIKASLISSQELWPGLSWLLLSTVFTSSQTW